LGVIFAVLDTDSNKRITAQEFKQKVRAMHMRMDDDEINALFRHFDLNNDGSISYNELVDMFAGLNTAQIIKKM
jgi:Ca2+-binding EF-hand superfamily protein